MGIWDIAYVLFKHKWRIVLSTLAIVAALVSFSFLWPPKFEANARFLLSKTTSVNMDATIFPQVTTTLMRSVTGNEEANNERQILLSRPVVEAVVQELNLADDYVPPEPAGILASIQARIRGVIIWAKSIPRWILESLDIIGPKTREARYIGAIEKLSDSLEVEQVPDSDVIRVSMTGWYPEHITAIVAETSRQYLRYHLEVHQGDTATGFYSDYLGQATDVLEGLEQELADYRSEYAIVDINKVEQAWLEKVEILERQRIHLRKELITLRSQLDQMREVMADPSNPIIPSAEINAWDSITLLNDQRIEQELRLTGFLDRYTGDHPVVEQQRATLRHVKGALREEVERLSFLMERQVADWESEDRALGLALEHLRYVDGAELPRHRQRLTQMERSISDANAIYEEIAKRRADAELRTAQDDRMVKVKLLEAATQPTQPVWPDLFLNIVVGVPLAPILAISIAFFVEGLRRTFRRAEDIEDRLEIDALAVLPAARNERALRDKSRRALEKLAAVAVAQPPDPAPTLLLTEAIEGEGATDVATLLAETLAASGRSVLLVDYRDNGDRARSWGVGPTAPPQATVGETEVHGTTHAGLSLARVGEQARVVRSQAELEADLAALRSGQDILIVDAPALQTSNLAASLAAAATGSMLVVRADATGQTIVMRAVDELQNSGTPVLGGILTGFQDHIPKFLGQRL